MDVVVDDRLPAGMLVEDEQHEVVVVSGQDTTPRRAALLLTAGYCHTDGAWSYSPSSRARGCVA